MSAYLSFQLDLPSGAEARRPFSWCLLNARERALMSPGRSRFQMAGLPGRQLNNLLSLKAFICMSRIYGI